MIMITITIMMSNKDNSKIITTIIINKTIITNSFKLAFYDSKVIICS